MVRLRAKRFSAGCAVGLAALASFSGCERRAATGPVVIYLVDTLRFDRMSAYGAKRPTSPGAERLAREGTRYDAAYSTASWTVPAVASLFTSRFAGEVGALGTGASLEGGVPVIAQSMRNAGWQTGAFCGQPSVYLPQLGFGRGFARFEAVKPIRGNRGVTTADRVVDAAVRWIESQPDPHFFLYVHVVDPHNDGLGKTKNPYEHWLPGYENLFFPPGPPQLESRDWRLAKYDALIRQADDQFSRLRKALEKRGFWKPALVVYLADHGEEFYEHEGLYHGHSLFEELVRIPLIVKAPGKTPPGSVVKSPVSILDVFPSIAQWAGIPQAPDWRGRPLFPPVNSRNRSFYFSDEEHRSRFYGLRRENRKMIISLNPPFRIEFDLERDPSERHPISEEAEMEDRLENFRGLEMSSVGGLWLKKADHVSLRIDGRIALPDNGVPYLSLRDYGRFPIDPADPMFMPIHREVGADEPFAAHFLPLDEDDPLDTELNVKEAGSSYSASPRAEQERLGNLNVSRLPSSKLSRQELSEVVKNLKALGYLGGN